MFKQRKINNIICVVIILPLLKYLHQNKVKNTEKKLKKKTKKESKKKEDIENPIIKRTNLRIQPKIKAFETARTNREPSANNLE